LSSEIYPHPKRLMQILAVTLLAMLSVLVQNVLGGRWLTVEILLIASVPLAAAMVMTRRGHLTLATCLTLIALALMATVFLWIGQGLRDTALLIFPGILVIAAIQGQVRVFLGLLAYTFLALGAILAANLTGWHVNVVKAVTVPTFLDLSAILMGLAFTFWVLASDLRGALRRLKEENLRFLDSQDRLDFLAQHDVLTGLPNRTLGQDRLEQAMGHAQRNNACAALIVLDLDDFKAINDALGHQGGDDLLRSVAQRLKGLLRATDTVCRQGGDEFLLILSTLHHADEAAAIALKVLDGLAEPMLVQGLEVTITPSLGIALYPADGHAFDTLLQKADRAMYHAKESGRNTFRFFLDGMNAQAQEHLHLVAGLRAALEQEAFVLHYQPQYDLATGAIVGVEALIRWQHPELGLIPPGTFIPVAERSGLIGDIGAWALREACHQAEAWRRKGLRLVMAVNLSPVQFRRDDLERTLFQALEASGLPPSALELELTESMLLDDTNQISQRLRNLRAMGVSFAIDDFGTGYSNLGYLKRFEVERLKIDQSFIRRLTENAQDEAIVGAVIQMAHGLKLGVVAEGIEDEATLARLVELGCGQGQGFLWAKALPAEAFEAFVARAELTAR
jgi:diguanylate cyclase (GGDEF)-like protein